MDTTAGTRTVACPHCGRLNRVPAAARGRPRCGHCKAFLPWIADASDGDFVEIAEQATIPVLVDFWAAWCGPCRMVSPALEQLANEKAGQLKLVKVDIERAPKLAQRFSVQAVPTLMVMNRGEVIARQPGAAPIDALRRWVDGAMAGIPSDS
jgi:thioredoxin 2